MHAHTHTLLIYTTKVYAFTHVQLTEVRHILQVGDALVWQVNLRLLLLLRMLHRLTKAPTHLVYLHRSTQS